MKKKSLSTSLCGGLIIAGILAVVILPQTQGASLFTFQAAWIAFTGLIAFLIFRSGQISRWRAVFFITLAWGFLFFFKSALLGLKGRMFVTSEIQEVPFCHIAMVSQILNTGYQQLLAVQSGHWMWWGPLSLGIIWLLVTMAIGRGWCSWGCFYGGLDEGFSRLMKRPLFKNFHLPSRIRDLPSAILLFTVLISLGTMLPVFCLWICPLKITTAFLDPHDATQKIQMIIFIVVGVTALVFLPLIFKKRIFCGLICPFGAWQSFWGWLHPVRVTISPDLCTSCGACVKACPTLVLSTETVQEHRIPAYCNHCGECFQACPNQAISFTLLGRSVRLGKGPRLLRELADVNSWVVMASLLVGGAMGSLFVPPLLDRIFLSLIS